MFVSGVDVDKVPVDAENEANVFGSVEDAVVLSLEGQDMATFCSKIC